MKAHTVVTYLLSAVLISIFSGVMAYLAVAVVREPLLTMDYRGEELFLHLAGEQWTIDLTIPERVAQLLQSLWFFLPAKIRLLLQTVTLFLHK